MSQRSGTAKTLKSHPDLAVDVNGYCDVIGSEEYNLKLSQKSAESVVKLAADSSKTGASPGRMLYLPSLEILPRLYQAALPLFIAVAING